MLTGVLCIFAFSVWTVLMMITDIQPIGVNDSNVGFATINSWFNKLTGTDMILYNITDWLGLVTLLVCFLFAALGFIQLINRKSFRKVDADIIALGVFYIIILLCYLVFEMIPINYRPILINGYAENSYPSSTTLLVLSVMPTLAFQAKMRFKSVCCIKLIYTVTIMFSLFMVIGRLISGVHWLTDIVGSILLSSGMFYIYKSIVYMLFEKRS